VPDPRIVPIGLRPGVSFCEASGHLVFLDMEADRYFGLTDAAEAIIRQGVQTPPDAGHAVQIETLVGCGLLVDAPDARPLRACTPPPAPRVSLMDGPLPRTEPLQTATAIAALMRARLQLAVTGLAVTLRGFAARKAVIAPGQATADAIPTAIAAFRQSALYTRSHDQCLVRSLALARHLARRGEAVDLVIGVDVRPFSAHAWVQKGDVLLNETCDGVRGYTPILVL
jgi:hypothetical protein